MDGVVEFKVARRDVDAWNVLIALVDKHEKGERVVSHKRTAKRLCDTVVTGRSQIGVNACVSESAIQPV